MPGAAFVTPSLAVPGRRRGLLAPRAAAPRRTRLVITAKQRAAKPSDQGATPAPAPSSSGGDAFAGFAAGPAATPKPRLSRPKPPTAAAKRAAGSPDAPAPAADAAAAAPPAEKQAPPAERAAPPAEKPVVPAEEPVAQVEKSEEPEPEPEPEPELEPELEPESEPEPAVEAEKPAAQVEKSEEPEPETEPEPEKEPELRATRALGTSEGRKPEKIGRKTAADFIAEGIVDDVDDVESLDSVDDVAAYAAQDIRFGIADVKDPFLEEEAAAANQKRAAAAEADRDAVGKATDVTGDGGVTKRLVSPGDGAVVPQGATVRVEYTGRLADGTQFDSSRGRDGGFSFELGAGAVIKGWEAGVSTMRVGETAELTIQPGYAYGRRGMPPVIPGNATLTFEIEVLASEGGEEEEIKSVAAFNPDISRTPEAIARDYEQMLETQEERRKGKSWVERLYFVSPFMSQTGEKPPWWINPNITFFLIAVSVVIGFYFVLKSGAIHIGYTENVDVNIFK